MSLYQEDKIVKCAIITRIFIILLQVINNKLIPDHNAGVFLYPQTNLTVTAADNAVDTLFGGLVRWDAHYFMHISRYGYTYENTTAFFPLYPMIVKILTELILPLLPFLNINSITVIMFTVINFYIFIQAALTLYRLSTKILNEIIAFKATLLFCFNPASIFFVAPYTESLYCFLTFKSILYSYYIYECYKNTGKSNFKYIALCVLYTCLSLCTRSNGMLNLGFFCYFYLKYHIPKALAIRTRRYKIIYSIKYVNILSFCFMVSITPFIVMQNYFYNLFCEDFEHNLPKFLVKHGKEYDFVLPGLYSKYKQTWCKNLIPLSYSYVQEHYWNVGFLRYYEFKQLPNFLLAAPIVFIVLKNSWAFYKEHTNACWNLGIFDYAFVIPKKPKSANQLNSQMHVEILPFVFHAVVLTMFCVLCVHIQVTTRMLCSASPIVYWFCAYAFYNHEKDSKTSVNTFLFTSNLNKQQLLIKYYFLGYLIIGTMMFCNFLPWT